jgi:transposase
MTGGARVVGPDRLQLSWQIVDLEGLLEAGHRARLVWAFAETLDLSVFYAAIRSREGEAGRPAADPRVLFALWLYATLEGVGSARELERLVERDVAYRWLAGGVPVNYHALSDFRVGWTEELDRLLTESVTALVAENIVELSEVAVDGTKVAAPVSRRSFTKGGRLARIAAEARSRIAALKQEVEADPAGGSRRRRAAQARAAREAEAKVAKAREVLEKLRQEKAERAKTHEKAEKAKGEPKVSLSDHEARRMRFPDGAIRPAYNLQTAALPKAGLVLAVEASDRRNDTGLALPMVERLVGRYGRTPERLLLDEGYACREDLEALAAHPAGAIEVYMPVPTEKPDEMLTPSFRAERRRKRKKEPEAVRAWRERMQSEAGQAVFKRRKLIELIHAHYKKRALARLTVRGLAKTRAVALWHALANNLMAAHRLRSAAAAA